MRISDWSSDVCSSDLDYVNDPSHDTTNTPHLPSYYYSSSPMKNIMTDDKENEIDNNTTVIISKKSGCDIINDNDTCRNDIYGNDDEKPSSTNKISVLFHTVMTNLDFSLGYNINRQVLDQLINEHPTFRSLLETSFGYTGVNIKFPLDTEWYKKITFPKLQWDATNPSKVEFMQSTLSVNDSTEMQRFLQKPKYNTFLVFHSGNIIMSGMIESSMRDDFNKFVQFLKQHRHQIQESITL